MNEHDTTQLLTRIHTEQSDDPTVAVRGELFMAGMDYALERVAEETGTGWEATDTHLPAGSGTDERLAALAAEMSDRLEEIETRLGDAEDAVHTLCDHADPEPPTGSYEEP